MMRLRFRSIARLSVGIVLLCVTPAASPQAVQAMTASHLRQAQPPPSSSTSTSDADAYIAYSWPWPNCNYESRTDQPHWSSSSPNSVQAHGWWNKRGGSCTTATVRERIYGWWCQSYPSLISGTRCYWKWIDTGTKYRVRPGGGSRKRAIAHVDCVSFSRTVGFKAEVDVDIDGQWDGSRREAAYANLNCVPPGEDRFGRFAVR